MTEIPLCSDNFLHRFIERYEKTGKKWGDIHRLYLSMEREFEALHGKRFSASYNAFRYRLFKYRKINQQVQEE